MATVRRATRQVLTARMPGARRSAGLTAESVGVNVAYAQGQREAAEAETTARTWDAVAGAADTVTRIGAHVYGQIQEAARDEANETALLGASNQLDGALTPYLYDPDTGAYTRKGKEALPLPEETRAFFNTTADAIEAGLTTPEQKSSFAKLRAQRWGALNLDIARHVGTEMEQYRAGELEGFLKNRANQAVLHATDPKLSEAALGEAVSALRKQGPKTGLGPEAIDLKVAALTSNVRVGVISSLLAQEQHAAAQAYFDAANAAGQISGDQVDQVMKALEEGSARKEGIRLADQILDAGGTLTEQRAKARGIENARVRELVETRLEHEAALRDRAEREAQETASRTGYDIIDQTGDITKIPATIWANYSGATRSAIKSYAEQKAQGLPIETDWPTYYARMREAGDNPGAFVQRNLLADRNKLGDAEFKQLESLRLSLKNGDRSAADKELAPLQTRNQLIDDTLTLHGIDPNAKPETAEGKAIAQLRRMVSRRVDLLQGGGQKASNADIQSEIDGLLSQTTTVPGSWWNIFPGGKAFRDTSKRLLDLTITDVPAADRTQIEQALKARNRPISEAAILDYYLEMQIRSRR
jgi:hypothetical protein